jgi:hypothetical protein
MIYIHLFKMSMSFTPEDLRDGSAERDLGSAN